MKVLFLDCDGVLNGWKDFENPANIDPINPGSAALLREVLDATGAKVVISSVWRRDDGTWHKGLLTGWKRLMKECNPTGPLTRDDLVLPDFKTPVLSAIRGCEIQLWLDIREQYYGDVEKYAIIDDNSDMLPEQKPFFVKTEVKYGMCQYHADKLIELLS